MQSIDRRAALARRLTVLLAAMLAPSVVAEEQRKGPPKPEARIAAMAKLDYLVGDLKRGPNEWVETGERSGDGKTWQPFFEMTLAKP